MENNATFDALARLSREEPDIDDFSPFKREVRAIRNDRGAAILLATNVENALEAAIKRVLRPTKVKDLFRYGGPMGEFSSKISMAYALEIVGTETRRNLDYVRKIRNAFAHSMKPISFKTSEVLDACKLLEYLPLLPPHTVPKSGERPDRFTGRKRYQRVCEVLAHNLLVQRMRLVDFKAIARGAIRPELEKDIPAYHQLRMMPDPLP